MDAARRSRLAVARISWPRSNHQKPGRGVAARLMIIVLSSFIRLSEPISRGTVTGQRTSTTRLRVSCPTSRTSEHSRAGARGCDVRMFGCLPLDGPRREGGLFAGLRTYLPLRRTTLTQQLFGPRPKFRLTLPQRHRQFCASSSLTEGTRALDVVGEGRGASLTSSFAVLARLPENIAQQF